MVEKIKSLLVKYKKIISYILTSCLTAAIELAIGLVMIDVFSFSSVAANTVGVIIGSLIHYLLVTKKVFIKKTDLRTALIYIATFLIGMGIQNLVVYFADRALKAHLGTELSFAVSKGMSLVVSFVVMYQLRKKLYSLLGRDINE